MRRAPRRGRFRRFHRLSACADCKLFAMSSILVSLEAGVLAVTLNRPDKLNAFNPEMHALLRKAMERALDEPEVRAVLLTGAGLGFCAGQDLSERDLSTSAPAIDLSVSLG